VTDAEAAPQAALTATDESQPQEEAKSELPIAKESDEPRRGRNLRSDNPDFVAASRSESVQVSGKAAEVPVVTGAVAIPHDAKTASAEAAHEAATAKKAVAAKIETLSAAANRLDAAATRRSGRADASDGAPHVDSARFVGRVAKAFQSAQDRGGTLQLRLSPPELGSLRLELTVKDGVMTAALETETASARRVLLDHLPALRDRLAEQNIRVERFDVEVRRDNSEGQSDPRAPHDRQQPQHGDPQPRRRPTAVPRASDAVPQNVSIHPTRTINTRINIVA
jgi:flagellar hook-length control protein FliK